MNDADFIRSALNANPVNTVYADMTILSYKLAFEDVATVLESNVSLNEEMTSYLTFDLNGNTSYDLVIEEVNGVPTIKSYKTGTYTVEPKIVVLQPINR